MNIRLLTADDRALFPEAERLLNRTQGLGMFPDGYLAQRVVNPNKHVVAAFEGDQIIGLGAAELLTDYSYYRPFEPRIDALLAGKKVGSFSTMSVREDYQGKGVGQAISRVRLAWLRAQNVDVVFGVSWVSGLAHTSNRVFERMGFHAVGRREGFYHESSLKDPFVCPGCGDPPCRCAAILYRLDLTA